LKRWPDVPTFAAAGGYDPRRPRLYLVKGVAPDVTPRTSILFERIRRIYTHPQEFRGALRIDKKDDPRGELRQALVLVIMVVYAVVDAAENFDTGKVAIRNPEARNIQGIPVGPSWRLPDGSLSPSYMAWTGLSSDQIERAFYVLSRAGFQEVETVVRMFKGRKVTYLCAPQPIEVEVSPSGVVKRIAHAAIRVVTPVLARALGAAIQVGEWARVDGNTKERATKAAELERKERAQLEVSRLPAFGGHGRAVLRGTRVPYYQAPITDEETNRVLRLSFHQLEVWRQHPDWPPESQKAEAQRRLERETGPPPDDDTDAPF
jgi:hypothetical protein